MTPDQIHLLVDVISKAIYTFTWISGIAVTIMLAGMSVSTGLVYRAMSKRVDLAQDIAGTAKDGLHDLSQTVADAATHCSEMRAACREHIVGQFVPRKGIKAMDNDVKILVEQAVNATQAQVIENRDMVMGQYKDLKDSLKDFQDEIWEAFHSHRHAGDGGVIRGANPGGRKT